MVGLLLGGGGLPPSNQPICGSERPQIARVWCCLSALCRAGVRGRRLYLCHKWNQTAQGQKLTIKLVLDVLWGSSSTLLSSSEVQFLAFSSWQSPVVRPHLSFEIENRPLRLQTESTLCLHPPDSLKVNVTAQLIPPGEQWEQIKPVCLYGRKAVEEGAH